MPWRPQPSLLIFKDLVQSINQYIGIFIDSCSELLQIPERIGRVLMADTHDFFDAENQIIAQPSASLRTVKSSVIHNHIAGMGSLKQLRQGGCKSTLAAAAFTADENCVEIILAF